MNRRFPEIIAIAAIIVGMFAFGCKKENAEYDTAATNATTDSSTTNAMASDTSGTTSTNPETSATTGSATSSAAATPVSDDDKNFMTKAAEGGLAEVSLGGSVSPKATNPDVKSFADRMVSDHSKANDELKQLATTKSVTLPAEPAEEQKAAAQKVLSAKNVDKAYMDDMVKDHDKDVKEFEEASKKAKDPDLKAWIDKTLPVLKDHQKMAHDIDKKLK